MQRSSMVISGLAFGLGICLAACVQIGPAAKVEQQIDNSEGSSQEESEETWMDSAKTLDPQEPPEESGETVTEIIEETLDETK